MSGLPVNIIALMQELRTALRGPPSEAAFERWLAIVPLIDSSLEWGARCSIAERKLMEQIRSGVIGVISAHRSHMRPDISRATIPLAALEALLKERDAG